VGTAPHWPRPSSDRRSRFLNNPEAMLRQLCDRLGVAFMPAMLSWPAGPRDTDGVWAKHWYDAVWRSTGFQPHRSKRVEVPVHLTNVIKRAGRALSDALCASDGLAPAAHQGLVSHCRICYPLGGVHAAWRNSLLNTRISIDGKRRCRPRRLTQNHVHRLHADRTVSDVRRRQADGYEQVGRTAPLSA